MPQKGKWGRHLNVSKHPNWKSEQPFSRVEVLLNRKHWCQSGSNNVVDEHWIHYENLFCVAFCSAGGLNKLNRISHGWYCFRAIVVSTVTKFMSGEGHIKFHKWTENVFGVNWKVRGQSALIGTLDLLYWIGHSTG